METAAVWILTLFLLLASLALGTSTARSARQMREYKRLRRQATHAARMCADDLRLGLIDDARRWAQKHHDWSERALDVLSGAARRPAP